MYGEMSAAEERDFYPRPPRGGRLQTITDIDVSAKISIHALREEGDLSMGAAQRWKGDFYPRPPRGGRPDRRGSSWRGLSDFYPRPPRGGRHSRKFVFHGFNVFLSTPSARRATVSSLEDATSSIISIHALREEGDQRHQADLPQPGDFYPRPPRGGRQQKQRQNLYFQINYTTFCTNLEEP